MTYTIKDFNIIVADATHLTYAETICDEMASSAKARGTGIAKRKPEYVSQKIEEGKAVIALLKDGTWAGFCYIETWGHGQYVANSGLIVNPIFRNVGLAKAIKYKIFELSRKKYPEAKIFGLTTGLAVMKINSELGYEPVTYSELTDDEEFWKGCQSCVNFEILKSKERKNCMCTAMLYDPADKTQETPQAPAKQEDEDTHDWDFQKHGSLYERFMNIKLVKMLRGERKPGEPKPKSFIHALFGWTL